MKNVIPKFLFVSLVVFSIIIVGNQKINANVEADAECKKASQTCMIVINHGQEKSYPGILTVN